MSVLVVGVSHNSAPVSLLERVALDDDGVHKLIDDAVALEHVTEVAVISTCNRVEVYAEVDRFHGSVEAVSRLLVDRAGDRHRPRRRRRPQGRPLDRAPDPRLPRAAQGRERHRRRIGGGHRMSERQRVNDQGLMPAPSYRGLLLEVLT